MNINALLAPGESRTAELDRCNTPQSVLAAVASGYGLVVDWTTTALHATGGGQAAVGHLYETAGRICGLRVHHHILHDTIGHLAAHLATHRVNGGLELAADHLATATRTYLRLADEIADLTGHLRSALLAALAAGLLYAGPTDPITPTPPAPAEVCSA